MRQPILKFQEGGAMNDEQRRFTAFLVKVLEPTSQDDFEKKINSLSETQMKELYKEFKTRDQGQDGALMAMRNGGVIDYIAKLNKIK